MSTKASGNPTHAVLWERLTALDKERKELHLQLALTQREVIQITRLLSLGDSRPFYKQRQDAVVAALVSLGEASPQEIIAHMEKDGWKWHNTYPQVALGGLLFHQSKPGGKVVKVKRGRYRARISTDET